MKMTQKTNKAIELLAQGLTVAAVAGLVGVSENTIDEWLKHDDFKAAFQAFQSKQIADLVPLAITSLRDVLTAEGATTNAKLQAVRQVLELNNLKDKVDTSGHLKIEIEYV